MSIPWTPKQRKAVAGALERHPLESGRCEEAAAEILPVAKEVDAGAHRVKLSPAGRGRFVVPKRTLAEPWFHHYTTNARCHYVDVLTGADGTPEDKYLVESWKHPDQLTLEAA